MNSIKQGGVLSPTLFAVYTDELLEQLENTGVGCHIGIHWLICMGACLC